MRIFGGKVQFVRVRRILIVRPDRIGDVILTLPLATAIKRQFPQAQVHFLLRDYTAPLAEHHPDIDKVLAIPDSLKDRAAYRRCLDEVKSQNYDLAIVVFGKGDAARLIWDAGIPFRLGRGLRLHSWRYNLRVTQHRKHPRKHELDYNLDLIRKYVPVPPREEIAFRLQPDAKAVERVGRFLGEKKICRYAILHPGSGGSSVELPLETCARLLDAYDFPGAVLITGTSEESALYQGLAAVTLRPIINATGIFSIAELMALIARCDLFISSSTGPLHIARAFCRPLLGFYCTVPACHPMRWGPYGQEKSHTILPPGESYETFQRSKRRSREGMEKITVEAIVRRLDEIMGKP